MKNFKTISFSIQIDADRANVWKVLWEPNSYRNWTRVFMEGSHYTGELKEGNTIKFMMDDHNGMSSYIERLVPGEQMVFSHQKELKDGVEKDFDWQGAKEIYNLKKEGERRTELQVLVDIAPDMEAYFNKVFAEALQIIKTASENN